MPMPSLSSCSSEPPSLSLSSSEVVGTDDDDNDDDDKDDKDDTMNQPAWRRGCFLVVRDDGEFI